MSGTKKVKKQKQAQYQALKADKRDYEVAKYIHNHVAKRVGDLHGMEVDCFYAEDAINCLLDSPWATGKNAIFTDRHSVEKFGHEMLLKEMFHKASLVKRKPKLLKGTDGNDTPTESGTESKKGKKKVKQKEEEVKEAKPEEAKTDDSKKGKKVKKLKLAMSEEQFFADGREVYVWIYEPVSWKKFFVGFTILAAAIALCCYPLWPEWMRIGVYYLSLVGAAFLGVIIALAILRYIVWAFIYAITWKTHSFFLFPNLTEDCGFFESFLPIYTYTKMGEEDTDKKSKQIKDSATDEKSEAIEDKDLTEADAVEDDIVNEEEDDSENSQGPDLGEFEVIQESDITQ